MSSSLFQHLLCALTFLVANASYEFYDDGANNLFIGMSFFIPPAIVFDQFAQNLNAYSNHTLSIVFDGGERGAPGALWRNKYDEVDEILQSGTIEIFGLTVHSSDSDLIDFTRWIDLAHTYNPDTDIFIGAPYPNYGPDEAICPDAYEATSVYIGDFTYDNIILPLRALYPNVQIFYLNHGVTTAYMKSLYYSEGPLQGIPHLLGNTEDSLFTDCDPGHAGDFLLALIGLVYLCFLYDEDIQQLNLGSFADDVDRNQINSVVEQVLIFNHPYEPGSDQSLPDVNVDAMPPVHKCAYLGYCTDYTGLFCEQDSSPADCPVETTPTGSCFSPFVTVAVEGQGQVAMKDLVIGDKVMTAMGDYKTIFTFDHFHHSQPTRYLQIYTRIESKPLELTQRHMLFVPQKSYPIQASYIKVGDLMQTVSGPQEVTNVTWITRNGLYNPLTTDGTIVVNGIVASTYTSFLHDDAVGRSFVRLTPMHLEIGGYKLFSLQSILDITIAPYRTFCMNTSLMFCNLHGEGKLPLVHYAAYRFYTWWSQQSCLVQISILIMYVTFFVAVTCVMRYGNIFVATMLMSMMKTRKKN